MNISAGVVYTLWKGLAFAVDVDYYDLEDSQGWVYGVESGSFFVFRTGFKFGSAGY